MSPSIAMTRFIDRPLVPARCDLQEKALSVWSCEPHHKLGAPLHAMLLDIAGSKSMASLAINRVLNIALVACAAALSSCAHTDTTAQAVYQAKADYEIALTLAVKYRNQPACAPGSSPLACNDPRVLDILRKADSAAEATLNNAETTVRSPTATADQQRLAVQAAQSAVQALTVVLQQYGVK